jgi:hypothetical protein
MVISVTGEQAYESDFMNGENSSTIVAESHSRIQSDHKEKKKRRKVRNTKNQTPLYSATHDLPTRYSAGVSLNLVKDYERRTRPTASRAGENAVLGKTCGHPIVILFRWSCAAGKVRHD